MTEQEETAAPGTETLPPGVYPVWSPFDSHEAADALLKAFDADQVEQK